MSQAHVRLLFAVNPNSGSLSLSAVEYPLLEFNPH